MLCLLCDGYLDLLRRVSGQEPAMVHTNGASNARFYIIQRPDIQVLINNPILVDAHADRECLDARSLPAYYPLIRQMISLVD